MTSWEAFVFTFFNGPVLLKYWPKIAEGFLVTIGLAAVVVVTGIGFGLLLALLRSFGFKPINWLIVFLVDLFRALPPLVIIVLIYFGLPPLGLTPSGFIATWFSLSMVLAAFAEEIFWAGISAVPRGQWEAGRSTGLGFGQTLIHVVMPHAVRLTIPPLTNRTIAITKGTSLGSVVAVSEILAQSTSALAFSSNPSPLLLGAAAYLILFVPVVMFGRWVETRFAWKR